MKKLLGRPPARRAPRRLHDRHVWLIVDEAARVLRVTRGRVYQLIEMGVLRAVNKGGFRYVRETDVRVHQIRRRELSRIGLRGHRARLY